MIWNDTAAGDRFRHPDGTVMTVKSKRKTHAIVVMDYTQCSHDELNGVHTDRVALSHPVNPDLRRV